MKVVIQRVANAECIIDGNEVGKTGFGYLLLVGFKEGDQFNTLSKMVKKIANLRIFEDENGKMNLNLYEVKGTILSISQFTLYANLSKGNRPSFTDSMEPVQAKIMYHQFNDLLRQAGFVVSEGVFGAHMDISLTNCGPVTIIIEL
ncbi:MAG: D-aminoacyl-tRNA deacylase [Bacilli bacterium]